MSKYEIFDRRRQKEEGKARLSYLKESYSDGTMSEDDFEDRADVLKSRLVSIICA